MTRSMCEQEDHTSAAVLRGTVNAEVATHARQCPVCRDILLVSNLLRGDHAVLPHECAALPDPGALWHKAKRRATQAAVRRALRPIGFMKIIAIVAFLSSSWLGFLLPLGKEVLSSWTRNLDFSLPLAPKTWPATPGQVAILLGFAGATLLLGVSSWYLVRQE